MAEGVAVADEQGVVLQINPAGERLWGYACNEVVGQPASMFSALPPAEAAALMGEVLAALQRAGRRNAQADDPADVFTAAGRPRRQD